MKLFQRIFAIFCIVIIIAIGVASFSFMLVQNRMAENHFKQRRAMEVSLLANALTTFQNQGEEATRKLLERWRNHPASKNIIIITGDSKKDIINRPVGADEIQHAYNYALQHAESDVAFVYYDPFGEEYLFFIRYFDQQEAEPVPTLLIPGLPVAPVWHEFIIFAALLVVGLTVAYLVAANISKPIRVLTVGMKRLAAGDLDARVSQHLDDRKDELAELGMQFDRMAGQLQQLVAKERHLLHHVSHEMRSPLARMQAILGLMQARPEKQEEYTARLESELTRMDLLVGELLTLSRLETANVAMEKELFSLVPFLEQIVEDSQAVAEQNGQTVLLTVKNLTEDAKFKGNESYLYRAFDNVIRNAMNYSPSGSTIKVAVHEDRKNLHINISDNGPGIKEEQLPHIFTAFYRAESSGNKPGTGLGLAITKHVTEQHEGKLIAENLPEGGLNMHFILPKTCRKAKQKPV